MKLTSLIAIPLLLLTQGFTLIITHQNGQKTEIPTEEISNISFVEDEPDVPVTPPAEDPYKLAAPVLNVSQIEAGTALVTWAPVPNCTEYAWSVDDSYFSIVTEPQVTIRNLEPGTHTVSVYCYGLGAYKHSDTTTETFEITATVTPPVEEGPELTIAAGNIAATNIQAYFTCSNSDKYYVGIAPENEAKTAAAAIAYINSNPETCQRKEMMGLNGERQMVFFTKLEEGTKYVVAAYAVNATDKAVLKTMTTAENLTPNTTGTLYVRNIDFSAPTFKYDVDKIGDLTKYGWTGSDAPLCWACAAAGMLQWWLDDYKAETGNDYPLARTYRTPSKAYTTPIMDAIIEATTERDAGEAPDCIKWFLAGYYDHPLYGTPSNASSVNDFSSPMNPAYANWRGGFVGMTWDEATNQLFNTQIANDGYFEYNWRYFFNLGYSTLKTDTAEEVAQKFSELTLDALKKGPLYICLGGDHALSCWGAEYKVLSDGTPQITYLYICENDLVSANPKGKVEKFLVTYEKPGAKWKNINNAPHLHTTGSYSTLPITLMSCLKGYGVD